MENAKSDMQERLLKKVFLACDENMEKVNDFVHSVLPSDYPDCEKYKIDVAVEEIFVNIAHYAYGENQGDAEISAIVSDGVLRIVFSDSGTPFNPLEREDPDITLSAEEREIGGLGIFLTKKFMTSVDYEYKDGKNILAITKKL